jgi:hypothetical protein
MRVAPRPIEVIVASEWDKDDDDDDIEEEEKDVGSVMDGGAAYYQLDLTSGRPDH